MHAIYKRIYLIVIFSFVMFLFGCNNEKNDIPSFVDATSDVKNFDLELLNQENEDLIYIESSFYYDSITLDEQTEIRLYSDNELKFDSIFDGTINQYGDTQRIFMYEDLFLVLLQTDDEVNIYSIDIINSSFSLLYQHMVDSAYTYYLYKNNVCNMFVVASSLAETKIYQLETDGSNISVDLTSNVYAMDSQTFGLSFLNSDSNGDYIVQRSDSHYDYSGIYAFDNDVTDTIYQDDEIYTFYKAYYDNDLSYGGTIVLGKTVLSDSTRADNALGIYCNWNPLCSMFSFNGNCYWILSNYPTQSNYYDTYIIKYDNSIDEFYKYHLENVNIDEIIHFSNRLYFSIVSKDGVSEKMIYL